MNEIKTTYNGVGIVYDQNTDLWRFTTEDGVERNATTLNLAIRAIEKPRKSKVKFEPIPIFYVSHSHGGAVDANVTSFKESRWCSDRMARISFKEGSHQRVMLARLDSCLPKTEKNVKLVEEWRQLLKVAEVYKAKANKLMEKAERLSLPEDANAD